MANNETSEAHCWKCAGKKEGKASALTGLGLIQGSKRDLALDLWECGINWEFQPRHETVCCLSVQKVQIK